MTNVEVIEQAGRLLKIEEVMRLTGVSAYAINRAVQQQQIQARKFPYSWASTGRGRKLSDQERSVFWCGPKMRLDPKTTAQWIRDVHSSRVYEVDPEILDQEESCSPSSEWGNFGYIYRVQHVKTGHVYIGQTVMNPIERWRGHSRDARKGSPVRFHQALRRDGEFMFRWEVIDTASCREELDRKEQEHITKFNACDPTFGYNSAAPRFYVTEGGNA